MKKGTRRITPLMPATAGSQGFKSRSLRLWSPAAAGMSGRRIHAPTFERGQIPNPKSLIPLCALALSACVSVLPEAAPPSARFTVSDVQAETTAAPVSWTLGVEEPEATLAYNSAHIALSRAPGRIEYYAGGEWVDRAPRLFGVALVRSFENTSAVRGVGSRLTLPTSTYVLQTDVRKLGVRMSNGVRAAEVEVFARLTNGRSVIHASRLFSASTPAAGDNAAAAAAALDAGLSAVQRDIIAWTLEEAERARQAAPVR
ncbi:MAG: ABC-type transport auxiliary lipoprotein family protein [Parvularculaceae bacterium]|nr:ABC-type transport auxiliary lipoprotein family protein [Parvularculaceae bacterium]